MQGLNRVRVPAPHVLEHENQGVQLPHCELCAKNYSVNIFLFQDRYFKSFNSPLTTAPIQARVENFIFLMQFFFQVCFQVIDETQLMNSGGIRSVFICLNKTLGLLLKAPP